MRSVVIHGLMFVLSMGVVPGCGLYFLDDDSAAPDAAVDPIPDAGPPPDTILESPCQGHGCTSIMPFTLKDGGEIRLERIQRGSEDTYVYAQALFFREQDPFQRPILGAEIASENAVYCYDMPGEAFWGHGPSAEGQAIVDTRAYLDVGDKITLASDASQVVLQRQPEGALDPRQGLQHEVVYVGEPLVALEPGASYAPIIEGSADYPTLDLSDAVGVTFDSTPEPRVFMPPELTLTQPAEADFFASGVALPQGDDAAFAWTSQSLPVSNAPRQLPFVTFMTEEEVGQVFCVGLESGEHDSITVPAEVLDMVSPAGQIAVGTFTHVGAVQTRYETRLDLVGMNSKVAPYTVTAAQ